MKKIITIFMGLIVTLFISLPIKAYNNKTSENVKKAEKKAKASENSENDVNTEIVKEELAKYSYFQTGTASFTEVNGMAEKLLTEKFLILTN